MSEGAVLLVDDDAPIRRMLQRTLTAEGYAVAAVADGGAALAQVERSLPDVIVLDVAMPGLDGLAVTRRLRAKGLAVPILLLTARDALHERVAGLDAGADDYLVKPFAFVELAARLRALGRRPAATVDPILRAGDVRLDPATRQVWRGETEIALPNKEFRILEYLMRHPNRVLTRTMIAEHVWDYDFPNVTNVIDVHIRSLRRRLDDPYPGRLIQTVRGAGYRLGGQP